MLGRSGRGFTLVECAVVCAVAALLATLALPSYRDSARRAARQDAIDALTRVQVAQEQYRNLTGLYAGDVTPLRGVAALSAQGLYSVTLAASGPDSYRATASARGSQAQDRDCAMLTLDVALGFAHPGPSAACWNR